MSLQPLRTQVAPEQLWAGPDFKIQSACFHYERMMRAAAPPELDAHSIAMLNAGNMIDTGWQRAMWPHFDAFLMTVRSVPEIIRCCFGEDRPNAAMRTWWDSLPADEQFRRSDFTRQYEGDYKVFRRLPMSEARHVTEHRTGLPDVEVTITGSLGVTYVGRPGRTVPISETPQLANPSLQFMAKPRPLQPHHSQFTVGGKPLFQECQTYLGACERLVMAARAITANVHGTQPLTVPPA